MTTSQSWQKIKQILQDALALEPEQWPQFLDQHCGDDPALRKQVAAYLRHRDDPTFMATPAMADKDPSSDLIGKTIGRYRIVRALGAGGMGEVFEAEQLEPFVRTVAIKFLRRELYTPELMARFESEYRALAMMNHPNIAQVFDADWTQNERPYFVMEFVPGERITEAVSSRELTLSQRLDLFVQACAGVQHAHRKGIIHRDIKPSNVLVHGTGDRLTAKVIDFGVAKGARRHVHSTGNATDQHEGNATQVGDWIGTSGYASPEQALGSADIDTRSDIYSLGALLYELLADRPAYDETLIADASREERLRIICEDLPRPPSEHIASRRERHAARLDLDSIVQKAMAKRPDDRYATVAELAQDLKRHQRHEPVSAVAGGLSYRLTKLVRRRALVVAMSAVAVALLVGGTLATGLGYLEATRAQAQAARAAQSAKDEAENATRVAGFLADLFRISDPGEGAGHKVTAREILTIGAKRINDELADQPATHAMLLDTIGVVYTNLGLYDDAVPHLETALATRESLHSVPHPDTVASLNHLGKVHYFQGDLEQAETFYGRAQALLDALGSETTLARAETHNNLGELHVAQGDFAAAIAQHEAALAIRRNHLGSEHRDVGMSLNNLAGALRRTGDLDSAQDAYRNAIAVNQKALGPNNPEVATNMANLGVFLMTVGDYDEAAMLHEDALAIRRRVLDPNHPHIANSLHNVGSLRVHLGHYDDAGPLIEESLTMHQTLHGDVHPLVALSHNNLGVVRENQNRLQDALGQYDQALDIFAKTVGDEHPYVAITQCNRARVMIALGDAATAATLAAGAAQSLGQAMSPEHWRTAVANSIHGEALVQLGQHDAARTLLASSYEIIVREQGEDTPYARRAARRLQAVSKPTNTPQ